ncbi:MAG: hypothetical protein MUC65_10835 [Pontiellaceae bacterium]|nr:hypothetical protein [Pontiellaceae bacterium]
MKFPGVRKNGQNFFQPAENQPLHGQNFFGIKFRTILVRIGVETPLPVEITGFNQPKTFVLPDWMGGGGVMRPNTLQV